MDDGGGGESGLLVGEHLVTSGELVRSHHLHNGVFQLTKGQIITEKLFSLLDDLSLLAWVM